MNNQLNNHMETKKHLIKYIFGGSNYVHLIFKIWKVGSYIIINKVRLW